MKRIIIIFISALLVSSCKQVKQDDGPKEGIDPSQKHTIGILTHAEAKKWHEVPVTLKMRPPMESGDILQLKHKENVIAEVSTRGKIRLQELSFRIRALGSGNIYAYLQKPNGTQSGWKRYIQVNDHGSIPENGYAGTRHVKRIRKQSLSMLISNDSAKTGYIKKITMRFDTGDVIICGSHFLSKNPYFRIKPTILNSKPDVVIEVAKMPGETCYF